MSDAIVDGIASIALAAMPNASAVAGDRCWKLYRHEIPYKGVFEKCQKRSN